MDSALARAARILVRRGVHLFRAPNATRFTDRRLGVVTRSRVARLGGRPHPEKCTARHFRPIRLHTQSALSRQFLTRARLHNRVRSISAGAALRGSFSWHLSTCHARRSLAYGLALWK